MATIRKVAFCPHCTNRAPQKLIHSQPFLEIGYHMADKSKDEIPSTYHVASCGTCNNILVYLDFADQLGPEKFELADLVWPKKKKLDSIVPVDIQKIYEEATLIEQHSPDAFAVQIRRALEAICVDRGVNEKVLYKALKKLADKGEIPPILAEVSDVLRLLGNIGAHFTGESVHPLQTRTLNDFFRVVIEYIYVAPNKLKTFKDQLPSFKKLN